MKLRKQIIVSTIALALAGQFASLAAKGPIDQQLVDRAMPVVDKAPSGLFVEAPVITSLVTMNVRVYNDQNELVLSERSRGEPVGLFASDLPDGKYRYEAVAVFQLDKPVGEGPNFTNEGLSRDSGSFTIDAGVIVDDTQQIPQDRTGAREEASLLDNVLERTMRLAGFALDIIIPSAHAANVSVSSSIPTVYFNDTDIVAQTNEWSLRAIELPNSTFQLIDVVGGNNAVLGFETSANNANSMFIDTTGDISWADGTLNLEKSSQKLAIGWANTATGDFSISSLQPNIWLHDETDTAEADWQLDNATVKFWSRPTDTASWTIPMNYSVSAPSNSLSIDSVGNVGFGTSFPAASLDVTRSDGTTQVLVNETGAPATRTLMLLQNPGRTHFKIQNTDFGSEWVFTNTGPAFFISLQGTGGPEFKIQNNGNATLAGTLTQGSDVNAKTAFTDIDSYEILDRISRLPVTKWEYKDARGEAHIGPMAQDFYAAFGLGGTETGISSIDTGGVALAAIKALNEKNNSLERQNADLLARLEELERQQAGIQVMMATLIEARQASPVLTKAALN